MFEPIKISGAVEIQATPVHPHSTTENVEVQQRVSENKSKEVETDEEDDTPNLMVEIANSLDARPRLSSRYLLWMTARRPSGMKCHGTIIMLTM